MIKISIYITQCFLFDSLMEELPFIHLNEEHFRLAMFEQLNGRIRYDPDRLAFVAVMILMLISSRS